MITSSLNRTARAFGAACTLLACCAFSTATWAQAGRVTATCGPVFMLTPSGGTIIAKVGDTYEPGTSFNTGSDGRVVITFTDGQNVALGPDSTFRITQYQFDANNIRASSSTAGLLSGTMRYVTGAIHLNNRRGVHISAGRSKVDILNAGMADFTLAVDTPAAAAGAATVSVGEIAMDTPSGRITGISAGQFSRWQPGAVPTPPAPLAAAPAVFQAAVAALQGTRSPTQISGSPECQALEAALEAMTRAARTLVTPFINPMLTPGGGGGCLGSPC